MNATRNAAQATALLQTAARRNRFTRTPLGEWTIRVIVLVLVFVFGWLPLPSAVAEEVAALIAYLASDSAAMITGENILIDGGYSSI